VIPPQAFLELGQAFLPAWATWAIGASVAALLAWQRKLGLALASLALAALFNAYDGLPLPVVWMLLLAALFWALGAHTPFGRHLYAIGGNRDAAFYAGIPIESRLKAVFALMGATAGAAGAVFTARVGAATSDAGRMMELDAIAAAVIGGTSLLGGRGSVWGALLGACVMASIDNGLSLMNTEAFWQPVIKGLILIAAVGVDIRMRKSGTGTA
jgi:D-xylose transport system permease protein